MAQIRLQPPDPFNFKTPDDWPRWRRRFEHFRVASGLAEEDAKKQISTLLYCLGEEADSVLTSTNATEDDRKDYDAILGKFDAFFKFVETPSSSEHASIAAANNRANLPRTSSWLYMN